MVKQAVHPIGKIREIDGDAVAIAMTESGGVCNCKEFVWFGQVEKWFSIGVILVLGINAGWRKY